MGKPVSRPIRSTIPGVTAQRVTSGNKSYNSFQGDARGLEQIATVTNRPIVVGNDHVPTRVTAPVSTSDQFTYDLNDD